MKSSTKIEKYMTPGTGVQANTGPIKRYSENVLDLKKIFFSSHIFLRKTILIFQTFWHLELRFRKSEIP